MLALSSRPWLGYSDQGKFNLVPMSYEPLDFASGGWAWLCGGLGGWAGWVGVAGSVLVGEAGHLPGWVWKRAADAVLLVILAGS